MEAEADFFFVAFLVQLEEAGEDFVANFVGPAVSPGLLLLALAATYFLFFIFIV